MMKMIRSMILISLAVFLVLNLPSGDATKTRAGIKVTAPSITVNIDDSFVRVTTSLTLEHTGAGSHEYQYGISIPDDAFLTNLSAEMNGSVYYGQVKEDSVAQKEFDDAVESGKTAIKIEKHSVTSFTMTLNLLADKPMDISFSYHQFLVKELGGYRVSLNPFDLLPSPDSGEIDISFVVNSPTMITDADMENLDGAEIEYQGLNGISYSDSLPAAEMNKEISLIYETADTDTGGIMQFYNDGEITYFLHTFAPGMDKLGNKPLEKDIVFIVDKSGSMSGDKMTQTKKAFKLIVNELSTEYDRFNIISFSSGYDTWRTDMQVPDQDNVNDAVSYINGLEASGGTNIHESLEQGLNIIEDDSSRMKIIVFLTDGDPTSGDIRAPNAICSSIYEKNKVSKVSIFSLGVGDDMKFEFLEKLSFMNYARAYRIDDEIDISEQIAHFYDTISTPLIYRLNLIYENAESVYQRYSPYLFEGQEHCVLGQIIDTQEPVEFRGTGITVNGTTSFRGDFTASTDEKPYIAQLWAFMHIRWCEEQMVVGETPEQDGNGTTDATYEDEIIHTAVKYQIVTEYTTMIMVVEEEEKVDDVLPEEDSDDDVDYVERETLDGDSAPPQNGAEGGGDETGGSEKFADDDDDDVGNDKPASPKGDEGGGYSMFETDKDQSEDSSNILLLLSLIVVIIIVIILITLAVVQSRRQRERAMTGMRRDIFEYIKYNPGEHLSNIMHEFDMSPSSTTYHLNRLEKGGKVLSHKDTKFKRYYAKVDGVFGGGDLRNAIGGQEYKQIVSALKSDSAAKIVRYIMENPGCTQKDISRDVGINPSTVNWHINKLKGSNIVNFEKKGKFNSYMVNDTDTMTRAMDVLNGNGNT